MKIKPITKSVVAGLLLLPVVSIAQSDFSGFHLNTDVIHQQQEQAQIEQYRQAHERAKDDAKKEKERIERIPAKDPFRSVDGRVVSVNAPGWVRFSGEVAAVRDGYVLVQGGFSRYQGFFVLTNFPERVWRGEQLAYAASYRALPNGKFSPPDGPDIPILDYELVWTPPPPTPEQLAAAASEAKTKRDELARKALVSNQEDAARGDSYGELRMGERYRDGDGVAKDLRLAREWLAKAAAHGDPSAKRELADLQ
jgi:hypothetical protein